MFVLVKEYSLLFSFGRFVSYIIMSQNNMLWIFKVKMLKNDLQERE